ncbi:hypothetical protein HY932_03010 [Candidatus Falkowbacteria bacterium]|nr:hypothetical protein [Candidatus Falkowbacteria bacterium]
MEDKVFPESSVEAVDKLSPVYELSQPQTRRLERHQIFSLIFVCVIGVAVIGLSVWEFSSIIGLELPVSADATTGKPANDSTTAATSDEDLKKMDTDQDGINDYDELSIYGTSPYLKDSDSDSFDDKTEIDSGNDPNCPKGQNCFKAELPETTNVTGSEKTDLTALANATPDQIREALVATGAFTAADLEKISDAELLKVYQDALNVGSGTTLSTGQATTPATTPANGGYSAAELKALLKQQGVSDEILSGIDDATLQQLYQDALKQAAGK